MSDEIDNMRYVPAIAIGGEATIKQRQRNAALYRRLRDGDGTGDFKSSGLASFTFEVPFASCSYGGSPPSITFRLDKDSDCFRRLLHVISDHFDTKCDADDEVERLTAVAEAADYYVAAGGAREASDAALDLQMAIHMYRKARP